MYNHSLVLKASVCSLSPGPESKRLLSLSPAVIIAHSWALKVLDTFLLWSVLVSPGLHLRLMAGVNQFTKFRAASCHCFASCHCSASCHCCHDPFIVRSAQTRLPFTGFTQLCTSVSTFTINVDTCLFVCCTFQSRWHKVEFTRLAHSLG